MAVYLDNAATSFPKPEQVYQAVEHTMRHVGVGPGRGGHSKSLTATRLVFDARETVADFFGVVDSSRIIFTHSATEALNLAVQGFLKPGSHVVTTSMEHNSLARPLRLMEQRGVEVTRVEADREGFVDPRSIAKALRPTSRLVALTQCSNVTGTIQSIGEIGEIAAKAGVPFLVDAAQSAGHIPIDVREMKIDLLAAPGHKGLLGPQGTGILYVGEGLELEPLLVGGTGGSSVHPEQPEKMPERLESGTLNTPGIAGLKAGIEYLRDTGLAAVAAIEHNLVNMLVEGLNSIERVVVHGPSEGSRRAGLASFTVTGMDPSTVGFLLSNDHDICVRVGLHCAPCAHRTIGTFPHGTVRVSPGCFNTENDIEVFLRALRSIVR